MDSRAWLTGYKSLPEGAVPAYAQQYGDGEHVLACYRVIEKALVDVDMAGSIVVQLKSFMQSTQHTLRRFALSVSPLLIVEYVQRVRKNENDYGDLEGLLMLIAMFDWFQHKLVEKRPLPLLQQSSIYHEAFLQSGDIMSEKSTYAEPIAASLTRINGANRDTLLTHIVSTLGEFDQAEPIHDAQVNTLSIVLGSPLLTEPMLIAIARVAFRLHMTQRSIKLLNQCYDHAYASLHLDALLIVESMRQNVTIENGAETLSVRKRVEEKSLRRAVTSKSIRHHEWTPNDESEQPDDDIEQRASQLQQQQQQLVAIVEMDEKKNQKSTQVAPPMKNADVQATENEPLLVKG